MNLNPEHLHVMLNHLPLIGLALALVPLLIGLLGNRRESLFIGLLLATLCGASTMAVMWSGEEAEHDWLHSERAGHLDADAYAWAEIHEHRAEDFVWVMYGTAAVSLVALLSMVMKKRVKTTRVLAGLAALGCVLSVAASAYIADSGGKISHPEFRTGPPPAEAEHGEYGEGH
ncbi:MAG: hypothetical protein AAF333_18065 [Planctomycetota bacterium]